jgi:tRNA(adenine34) deaminase
MTITPDDLTPMQLAIDASRAALQAGDSPYGATLVSAGGEVLDVAGNTQLSSGD